MVRRHWRQDLASLNPYTQQPWAVVPEAGAADAQLVIIAAARNAFDHGPWSRATAWQRAALMRKLTKSVWVELPGQIPSPFGLN